jgi:uncharacterized protein YjbI with pentapeptide repeats
MGWREWTGVGERRWKTAPNEQVQPSKTLWDWLQLLIVPAILVGVTFAWSYTQDRSDNRRADQVRQDATLNGYFQQMSDLMLDRKLLTSKENDAVRSVARTVTLATLRRLDEERKGEVVRFLREAQLISLRDPRVEPPLVDPPLIDLRGADLRHADLRRAILPFAHLTYAVLVGADLRVADLTRADLGSADLTRADLRRADLRRADLAGTRLGDADLRHADLREATGLTQKQLDDATTDETTKLPDYLGGDQSD